MLKIVTRTVRRKLTDVMEFIEYKNIDPMETMRQDAKPINFGLMFGASAKTFATTTLETRWTEEQCDNYIEFNNLYDLKDQIIARNPREHPIYWKYLTCSTDMRNKFFKTYTGLKDRIDRERLFAYAHGYIRSWHGPARRVPELFLMDHSESGRATGDDGQMLLYAKMIGNLQNIAANTAIQNFEASLVMTAITQLHEWLKKNNMKSYIWNSVHDSIDMCIYKPELDEVAAKIHEICTNQNNYFPNLGLSEDWGLKMDIDMVVSDLTDPNEYYKNGKKYKFKKGTARTESANEGGRPSTNKLSSQDQASEDKWIARFQPIIPTRKLKSQ